MLASSMGIVHGDSEHPRATPEGHMNATGKLRKITIAGGTIAALGIVSVEPVQARTVGAIAGLAAAGDMACMSISRATLTNACGHLVSLDIPLVIDGSGSKNISVTGQAASGANNVSCKGFGTNRELTTIFVSGPYTNLPVFGAASTIVLPPTSVPSNGQLFVNCLIENGGKVLVVNWTS